VYLVEASVSVAEFSGKVLQADCGEELTGKFFHFIN